MNKSDEMLDTLRKSIGEIVAAPEEGREEMLTKSFAEFREALSAEEEDPSEVARQALAKMGGEIAEEAGLAKNMSHVAEFAGLLRSIEMMLDRLAREAEGKTGPYVSYDAGDPETNKAHAAMLHETLDGWYGLGIRLLEVVVAAEAQNEIADLGGDDIAQIEADVARVRASIGLVDPDPEPDGDEDEMAEVEKFSRGGKLRKAAPPFAKSGEEDEEGADPADAADGEEADPEGADAGGDEEGPEVDDNAPLDPLDTLQRLLAACLVTVDAIRNADGGGEEDQGDEEEMDAEEDPEAEGDEEAEGDQMEEGGEEGMPTGAEEEDAEEEVKRAEKFVRSGLLRKRADADKAAMEKADLEASLAKAHEELAQLRGRPGASSVRVNAVALSKEDDGRTKGGIDEQAERLAKMSPEQRSLELFKAALSNPIGR